MIIFYVIFKDNLAEYEWKAPSNCLTEKSAKRMFKNKYPDLKIVQVITRKIS